MQYRLSLIVISLLVFCRFLYLLYKRIKQHSRTSNQHSIVAATEPNSIPLWDPLFGTDISISLLLEISGSKFLEGLEERFTKYGRTHTYPLGTTSIIETCDPENIKQIHTDAKNFPIGEQRRQGMAFLHGQGIFAVEGGQWRQARALLRSAFAKGRHDDTSALEAHFQSFLTRLRDDGKCVDIQEAYHKLTLDTAMEYFFGINPSEYSSSADVNAFLTSLDYAHDTVVTRLVFGSRSPQALWRWWPTRKAMQVVHSFVDAHVHHALSSKPSAERYVFLVELSKSVKDPIYLRDQVLTSLLGGEETTASVLSHVTFELARKPHLWARLQHEVDNELTQDSDMGAIRGLKFLRSVVLESLRLYTTVPINMRCAAADTTLPVGGGPSGNDPIRVSKGTVFWTAVFSMHRRKDLWGEDALDFNPDRWQNATPGNKFAPFGQGPRTCLGQEFALNESSFILARMAQIFQSIEPADSTPRTERVAITLSMANGCKVRLHRREPKVE